MFLGVNLLIALILMEANMFSFLNTILGFYANCGMSWVVTVATDITINKYLLKLSPKKPEFRRGMLYAINPVGFGSMLISAGVSILAFFGVFGSGIQPYQPLVAIGLAVVLPPMFAVATKGSTTCVAPPTGSTCRCTTSTATRRPSCCSATSAGRTYERPDMTACQTHDAVVCSFCLTPTR